MVVVLVGSGENERASVPLWVGATSNERASVAFAEGQGFDPGRKAASEADFRVGLRGRRLFSVPVTHGYPATQKV
jgi:hypothetical protein